jgi:hypothetical protein
MPGHRGIVAGIKTEVPATLLDSLSTVRYNVDTGASKPSPGARSPRPTSRRCPAHARSSRIEVNTDPAAQQLTGKDFTVTTAQSSDCQATTVTPTAAKATSMITISGTGMDKGCVVSFQGPFAAGTIPVRSTSALSLQAQVPAWHPGFGALRVAPQSKPDAPKEMWFQVLPQIVGQECEAYEVDPAVAKPRDKIYVYGTAMTSRCTIRFLDARGISYPAENSTNVDYFRHLVEVPYMPPGAAKAYSERADATHMKLNAAPFQVAEFAPRLVSAVPNQSIPGGGVELTGEGFVYPEESIRVRLEYYPGRVIDVVPTVSSPQKIKFVVPDIYNKITPDEEAAHPVSKVRVYRRDPAFSSNALDFRFLRPQTCPPPIPIVVLARPGYRRVGDLQCKPPQGKAYLMSPRSSGSERAVCCGEKYGTADGTSLCARKPGPCDVRTYWPKSFTPTRTSGTPLLDFPSGCYVPSSK